MLGHIECLFLTVYVTYLLYISVLGLTFLGGYELYSKQFVKC